MNKRPWISLKRKIIKGDVKKLVDFLQSISSSEKARALSRIDKENISKLLQLLPHDESADLIKDLPNEQAAGLMEGISPNDAAKIVDLLPKKDQIDILNDFSSPASALALIETMPFEEAEETRRMLKYSENTAGGMMGTEYLAFSENMTVGEVIDNLQANSDKYSDYDVQYAYIINGENKLKGVLRLRELLLSSRNSLVKNIMISDPIKISVETKIDELIDIFEECDFVGIPVVDQRNHLLGIARRYEIMEAMGERETDTFLKSSGIIGGEELRSMPLLKRSGRRLSWLSVNIILNILAASVIAFYQDTLSSVIALAVFLPIISDMSGCSGNQAVAVSIRELTMGITKPSDLFNVLLKECNMGIINGFILGILLAIVAMFWKGNPYLGLVVGGALMVNTLVSVCIGGIIPLVLKKFKKDPALASGPILTTITDMCGFFFVLAFATKMLPLIH